MPDKRTNLLETLSSACEGIAGVLSACAMAAIVLIATTQVFTRYFLNDTIYWGEEACRTLLIWTCFLFAGTAFRRGEMAAVELVISLLPNRLRNAVLAAGYTITAAFLAVLTYFGWAYATQNWVQPVPGIQMLMQSLFGDAGGFSIFWLYVALPIGCAILGVTLTWSSLRLYVPGAGEPKKD